MPGIYRYSLDKLHEEIEYISTLKIPAIALFPKIENELKTPDGKEALNSNNLICEAIRISKKIPPTLKTSFFLGKVPTYTALLPPTRLLALKEFAPLHVYSILHNSVAVEATKNWVGKTSRTKLYLKDIVNLIISFS